MANLAFVECNLFDDNHIQWFKVLMNAYMEDPMGKSESLDDELAERIISGLKQLSHFRGFFVTVDGEPAAMANCFINFSTFKAQRLLNIHDFIVSNNFRQQGVGRFLLSEITEFCSQLGFCRINLEVRHDNEAAMELYLSEGFCECNPPMYFWEKNL